jgi:signal transduction histidine kinase
MGTGAAAIRPWIGAAGGSLLLLAGLAVLPPWAFAGWQAWRHERAAAREGEERLTDRALAAARDVTHAVGPGLALLESLAAAPGVATGDAAACASALSLAAGPRPKVSELVVTDAEGQPVCAAGAAPGTMRMALRLHLRNAADADGILLGDYRMREGVPVAAASRAVPSGASRRVVSVVVPLDALKGAADRLGRSGTALLVDDEGVVMAAFPEPEKWTGRSEEEAPLVRSLQGGASRVDAAGVDGVRRTFAAAPLAWDGVKTRARLAVGAAPASGGAGRLGTIAIAALAWLAACLLAIKRWAGVGAAGAARPTHDLTLPSLPSASSASEAEGTLRSFSRQLLMAQEEERRRIARELHDEIGQLLASVMINLQGLQRTPAAAPFAPRLESSVTNVSRAIHEVRNLSLQLRPPMLEELGLPAALRWYANRQASEAKLELQVSTDGVEMRLPPEVEVGCFRVAQEALTNVVRHSRARVVSLELYPSDDGLQLVVRDDGVGFGLEGARQRAMAGECMGLSGMQERVSLLGGRLELSSNGEGTEIRAWFPTVVARRGHGRSSSRSGSASGARA